MTDRLRALTRAPALWLFLLLLSLYSLTQAGDFLISDGEVVFQTTVALARGEGLPLECNPGLPQIVPGVDGQCFSKYGLGMPLLAAGPFLFAGFLTQTVMPRADAMVLGHFFVSFMNLGITAGTGVVLYAFARDLYASRWLGLVLALIYGIATSAWPYSKVFFSEPLIAFLLILAAYAIHRYHGPRAVGWLAVAGAALGYAVFTKVATVVALPAFGLYLLWRLFTRPWPREEPPPPPREIAPAAPNNFIRIGPRLAARQAMRRPSRRADPDAINRFPVPLRGTQPVARARATAPRAQRAYETAPRRKVLTRQALLPEVALPLAVIAAPMLLCLVMALWHNAVRFGSPFDSGYSDEGFTTPFYVGLYGFLLSSGKSIFLYAPPVALSLPAMLLWWRRRPAETLLCAGIFLVTLVYYSSWWAWHGGWSWGPRFLVPTLPFLVLPLGVLLQERRWARWAMVGLAAASVGVQLLGALVDFNAYIGEIVADNPANEAMYIFYPWLSPLIGHLRYLVKGHHIVVATFDMTRLGFSHTFARIFPPLVIGTLLVSIGALAATFWPRPFRRAGGRS